MSQGKEKLVLCSNTLSLSFTTQNHPYKCTGAFKSNTCYRRIRAQKVLSSTTQSGPLRIYAPDQRGREANSSQTFLIGPKELITCEGRRGSHVHIYPPECKSRGSQKRNKTTKGHERRRFILPRFGQCVIEVWHLKKTF